MAKRRTPTLDDLLADGLGADAGIDTAGADNQTPDSGDPGGGGGGKPAAPDDPGAVNPDNPPPDTGALPVVPDPTTKPVAPGPSEGDRNISGQPAAPNQPITTLPVPEVAPIVQNQGVIPPIDAGVTPTPVDSPPVEPTLGQPEAPIVTPKYAPDQQKPNGSGLDELMAKLMTPDVLKRFTPDPGANYTAWKAQDAAAAAPVDTPAPAPAPPAPEPPPAAPAPAPAPVQPAPAPVPTPPAPAPTTPGPEANNGMKELLNGLLSRMLTEQQNATTSRQGQIDDYRNGIKKTLSTIADRYSQPVSPDNPQISSLTNAYRGEGERAMRMSRESMAERAHAEGLPTGAFDASVSAGYSDLGRSVGGYQAKLMYDEMVSNRDQLMKALEVGGAVLSDEERNAITDKVASLDAATKQLESGRNYDLGLKGIDVGKSKVASDFALGSSANALTGSKIANDLALGRESNANSATRNAQDFTLGAKSNDINAARVSNDLSLGTAANTNTATRNANDFSTANKGLDLNKNLADQRLALDKLLGEKAADTNTGRLNLDTLLGTGTLDLNKARLKLDEILGNKKLDIDKLLGEGQIGVAGAAVGATNHSTDSHNQQFYDDLSFRMSQDGSSLDELLGKLLLAGQGG